MIAEEKRTKGKLVLSDGERFDGWWMGAARAPVWGEVVFNTSMTGYQEVVTDPSYAGQIVVMTYPQIGNYGVHADDDERPSCAARGLVVRELSTFFSPAPGRVSLEAFMRERGLPGLTGVDTRRLTRRIRSGGAAVGAMAGVDIPDTELRDLAAARSQDWTRSLVEGVSGWKPSHDETAAGTAAVVDLGVKGSIVERVRALGLRPVMYDTGFDSRDILGGGHEFVVLSNGPGDPTDIPGVVSQVDRLIGRIPILGICLGHQVVALALGAKTYKLAFGHHGANQPVVAMDTGAIFITSQNHGYAVGEDVANRPGVAVTYTNANDGTLEGFRSERLLIECVQFHPEASPGPHDTAFVFEEFYTRTRGWRDAADV